MFRGEPLCDVESEGSVAQWRRSLEEKRLQATVLRIDADLAAGPAGELVAELERLTAEHPFEERLWGQLMLALSRAGRQADALEAYQRARRAVRRRARAGAGRAAGTAAAADPRPRRRAARLRRRTRRSRRPPLTPESAAVQPARARCRG